MPAFGYEDSGLIKAADGTRLFYGVAGDGPPCLLLDGVGCDGWAWNLIQPHLRSTHRTIHCHYRGHGRSGALVDPTRNDITDLADDAYRVLDHLEVEQTIVVAHSMGTQVALEMVRTSADRIGAMILICGSSGEVTHTFHGNDLLHRILPTLIEKVDRYRPLARALWGRLPPALSYKIAAMIGEIDGPTIKAEDFQQYVEHLSDIELDLYLAMLQRAGDHSAEDLLPTIDIPTLVVAAERDTFTPPETVQKLADEIPDAHYVELAGASHAAPLERASAINAHIDDFLSELGAAR